MKHQYENVSELAADEEFIQWVKAPTPEKDQFWESWLQQNPFQGNMLEEARHIVLLLSEDEDELHEHEFEAMRQHLDQVVRAERPGKAGGARVVMLNYLQRYRMMAVAASVTLLLLLSWFFLFNSPRADMVKYTTDFGEKRTVQLPDKSVVVLNGNTTISFSREWSDSETRLIQLEGEAFFEVTHQKNDQEFVVQTEDGVRVEVLGTAFGVTSRKDRNRVVLASGKVRLRYEQASEEKQLVMKPGELVEVAGKTSGIIRKVVSPEQYTSWKDNKVIFNDTSLQEIARMLEEVYGYKVTMQEAELADMKLTAQLDDSGIDNILATVSETLGVTIEKQNQEIKISLTNN